MAAAFRQEGVGRSDPSAAPGDMAEAAADAAGAASSPSLHVAI